MAWLKGLLLFCFCFMASGVIAQDSTGNITPRSADTARPVIKKTLVRKPVRKPVVLPDSLRRDSVVHKDSIIQVAPVVPQPKTPVYLHLDTFIYTKHPFFRFTDPVRFTASERKWVGMEGVFYSLIVLLIFFAIIRNAFAKYLNDLFRLYFRATLKQRQIREQLMQAAVPSLLLNILFFVSAGLYVTLIFEHYGWGREYGFWLKLVYAITALLVIYLVKFLVLKVCGWIFRVQDAADAYTFIVFTNNKILGILLLPFDLFLAFTKGMTYEIAFSLSLLVVGAMFAYRFFIAFATIQRQLKINIYHFLLYLLAFEVAPVLLINKLLLKYIIERS